MKVFENESTKKSWSIKLTGNENSSEIVACDSQSGDFICYLITFAKGVIASNIAAKNVLEKFGYNPYEHRNKFDKAGKIIIGE